MLLALLTFLVQSPWVLWCRLRHKQRYWRIAYHGWGWSCDRDGFEWAFSPDDVRRIMS
jgi:hypothetical protein